MPITKGSNRARPGGGSRGAARCPAPSGAAHVGFPTGRGRVKKILVADDDPNLRLLVRTTLEDAHWEIVEAVDGRSALEEARKDPPDLVVLDWMMPGLSGIEAARALRSDPETRLIPIIMLTAKGQVADRAQAAAAGVTAYLVKPFSPLELLEKVQAILA